MEFEKCFGPRGCRGCQGPCGFRGTQGSCGLLGYQGPENTIGPQGPRGTQGQDGAQGAEGPQGFASDMFRGMQGPRGQESEVGQEGAQGPAGAQGFEGSVDASEATGYRGQQGITGNQGSSGTQGLVGLQGFVMSNAAFVYGQQGLDGFEGLAQLDPIGGFQGLRGTQGAAKIGAQGVAGMQGQTRESENGAEGSVGQQGFTGPQAELGAQGNANDVVGPQGNRGTFVANPPIGLYVTSHLEKNDSFVTLEGRHAGQKLLWNLFPASTQGVGTYLLSFNITLSSVLDQLVDPVLIRLLVNDVVFAQANVSYNGGLTNAFLATQTKLTAVDQVTIDWQEINNDVTITASNQTFIAQRVA